MEKKDLINSMQRTTKNLFATRQDVADWFNLKDPHYAAKYLAGVEAIDGKYYFIPEIAAVLKARAVVK